MRKAEGYFHFYRRENGPGRNGWSWKQNEDALTFVPVLGVPCLPDSLIPSLSSVRLCPKGNDFLICVVSVGHSE